jgi:hypothetical protein
LSGETAFHGGLERSQQSSQIRGEWEVLALLGDPDHLDPIDRLESLDHLKNELIGCRCTGGKPDDLGSL